LRQQLLSLGFDENEEFSQRMLELEKVLADERLAVMKRFADEAKSKAEEQARAQAEQWRFGVDADRNLEARRATLANDTRGASLIQFDLQAEAESRAFRDQLLSLGWEKTNEDFARRMVDLEKVLADERLAVMKRFADEAKAKDEARLQFGADFDRSLGARRSTLAGDARGASLMQFDLRAEQENRALKDQLRNLGFDDASEDFARRVVDLEKIIADERLAVMKEFDRQAQEQAKAQADRMRGITQGLLESLTLGDLGGLPLEARYGAALSSLSAAQRPLLDGATPDELAEFARVAQIALPIAKDFLGVSGSFAELVADVSRTLGAAAPGSDPANLGALLEAQVAGSDRLELAVIGTGQAQTEVLQSLLKELKRLTAQNEAILARS
jgi:Zn-finger nucleic acid-binding protein